MYSNQLRPWALVGQALIHVSANFVSLLTFSGMQQKSREVTSSWEIVFSEIMEIDLLEVLLQKTLCLYHVDEVCRERHSASKACNLFLFQGASQNKEDPSLFCCALLSTIPVYLVLLKFKIVLYLMQLEKRKKVASFLIFLPSKCYSQQSAVAKQANVWDMENKNETQR